MREVLFKGKRKDNGEWIESYTVIHFSNNGFYMPDLHNGAGLKTNEFGNIVGLISLIYEVIPKTIGQYTGCCDKSKTTKVFEGDIVWDEIDEQYGVVEFDEGEFVVNFNGIIDADRFADVINCCYVCGNIHDNPELIKKI